MRCIKPITLGNRDVPCGKCNFCLAARRGDWCFRLEQELRVSVAADFLTLTYSDDHLPIADDDGVYHENGVLVKRHLQLFMKRLRKRQSEVVRSVRCVSVWGHTLLMADHFGGLRYYSVGEYGNGGRPHYHSILFNLSRDVLEEVPEIWKLGHIYRGEVNGASINYVAKFHVNAIGLNAEGRTRPFAVVSNRSGGIGKNYLDSEGWHRSDFSNYVMSGGVPRRLPKYYKDRFFSPDEKDGMRREFEVMHFSSEELEEFRERNAKRLSLTNEQLWHKYRNVVHKNLRGL